MEYERKLISLLAEERDYCVCSEMKRCKVTMLELDQNNEIKTKQRSFTLAHGLDRKQEKERLLVSSINKSEGSHLV